MVCTVADMGWCCVRRCYRHAVVYMPLLIVLLLKGNAVTAGACAVYAGAACVVDVCGCCK